MSGKGVMTYEEALEVLKRGDAVTYNGRTFKIGHLGRLFDITDADAPKVVFPTREDGVIADSIVQAEIEATIASGETEETPAV